ncbi:FIVAR domain-containing protein, partial [Faecalimonas umbilicata]|nr:FIVAR domain-containing protein [Faecalimonas umbilicata]
AAEALKYVEKDALKAAIDGAINDSEEDKYTPVSWEAYQAALTAAKLAYASDEATQKQVDDAVDNLAKATEGLVENIVLVDITVTPPT